MFGGFSGATRVEEVVPKGPDLFLHSSQCPVQVEVLDDQTHIVALREGPPELVQCLQPIAHQLRLAQLLHLGLFLVLALHTLTSRSPLPTILRYTAIHRSAWKLNSQKSMSRILHKWLARRNQNITFGDFVRLQPEHNLWGGESIQHGGWVRYCFSAQ